MFSIPRLLCESLGDMNTLNGFTVATMYYEEFFSIWIISISLVYVNYFHSVNEYYIFNSSLKKFDIILLLITYQNEKKNALAWNCYHNYIFWFFLIFNVKIRDITGQEEWIEL